MNTSHFAHSQSLENHPSENPENPKNPENPLHGLWLLLPFCLSLFLVDLDAADLWPSHEARAAQNAQCMLDDGCWTVPHLNDGQVELQKPPAFYWLVACTALVEGGHVDRLAVRLPSAVAALLTVFSVWHYLTARGRPLAGQIAGIVLASTIHFTSLARTGRIDMALTCAISVTLLALAPIAEPAHFANRWPRAVFAALALAVAILLKGPIGLLLPMATMAAWLVCSGRCNRVQPSRSWLLLTATALLAAILASPWFILVNERTDGEFLRVFFWYHNVDRAMGDAPALAVYPWYYYIPRFAARLSAVDTRVDRNDRHILRAPWASRRPNGAIRTGLAGNHVQSVVDGQFQAGRLSPPRLSGGGDFSRLRRRTVELSSFAFRVEQRRPSCW